MDRPKLSVVTVSYNQADYLERTICSVLGQGYDNLEYIIIDAGSTDGSVDIIRKYESELSFWVSEPDKGQVDGINKGLRRATGDFVAFQNSDDIYYKDYFDTVGLTIIDSPNVDLIYADLNQIDEQDLVLKYQKNLFAHLWLQVLQPQVHNQVAFWRRDLLDKIGYLNPQYSFAFDAEFFCRILAEEVPHIHLPVIGGGFRVHQQSRSTNENSLSRANLVSVRKLYGPPLVKSLNQEISTKLAKLYKAVWCIVHGDGSYLLRKQSRRLDEIKSGG